MKLLINYTCDGRSFTAEKPDTEHFTITVKKTPETVRLILKTKKPVSFERFAAQFDRRYDGADRIFVNGYQSWTDSREYFVTEKMTALSRLTETFIMSGTSKFIGQNRSGDYTFCDFPRRTGVFYGFSYGYVRNGRIIDLYGSLSERCGYTVIRFDAPRSRILVEKELEGVVFDGTYELLSFAHVSGEYDEAFDRYFELMNVRSRQTEQKCGYTTWYNYYGNINEQIVRRDLDTISELPKKIDIFQIDDGFQKAIGDWLETKKERFPHGMKPVADAIHEKGMLAGLWLAPFAVTKNSDVFRNHPDWIVRDENGKPFLAGPNWGTFYALDFYNEEAAAHIRNVFRVVLEDWGYDMVKLDFLYACCVRPMHNKSRGQIMCEAMEFIRDCVGDKLILGCGVPLMPAFGKVDFCRIGADVSLSWNKRKYAIREDVSTPNTISCTIFRRGLNKRAFINDPDVFLLRDQNISMNFKQRCLLAEINSIFGGLLFTSDNVGAYSAAQRAEFLKAITKKNPDILLAEFTQKNTIHVEYRLDGALHTLDFNVNTGKLKS